MRTVCVQSRLILVKTVCLYTIGSTQDYRDEMALNSTTVGYALFFTVIRYDFQTFFLRNKLDFCLGRVSWKVSEAPRCFMLALPKTRTSCHFPGDIMVSKLYMV